MRIETGVDSSGKSGFVEITDPYTLDFSIRRSMGSQTQSATLRLFNLAPQTRDRIFKDRNTVSKAPNGDTKWRFVKLWAGYGNFRPLIFNGQLLAASSQREGVDFITTIEGHDSLSVSDSFTNVVFSGPVTRKELVEALAKDLKGIDAKPIIGDFPSATQTSRGVVLSGNTWGLINVYTEGRATIDNGQLKVLFDRQAIVGGLPILNAETGLLGTPRRGASRMEVPMLFEPRLTLGQRIELQSQTWSAVNRVYQVSGFTHRGVISAAVSGECVTDAILYGPSQLTIIGGKAVIQ